MLGVVRFPLQEKRPRRFQSVWWRPSSRQSNQLLSSYQSRPWQAVSLSYLRQPTLHESKHFFLGTQADNMHDCHIKGRTASGENHGRHKVTFNQVTEIRASNGTCKATGRKFGISAAETCNIRNYKNWIT